VRGCQNSDSALNRVLTPFTGLLTAEHEELMPQHQKLDVFGEVAASPSQKQLQDRREREIGEGKDHSAMLREDQHWSQQDENQVLKSSGSQLQSPGTI
jgi:hypothetical protein